jgi:hypothetical protein
LANLWRSRNGDDVFPVTVSPRTRFFDNRYNIKRPRLDSKTAYPIDCGNKPCLNIFHSFHLFDWFHRSVKIPKKVKSVNTFHFSAYFYCELKMDAHHAAAKELSNSWLHHESSNGHRGPGAS